MFGIFETSTKWRNMFSMVLRLDVFRAFSIILGRPGKRSDGTDCPQALVPRQGDLQKTAYGHGGF